MHRFSFFQCVQFRSCTLANPPLAGNIPHKSCADWRLFITIVSNHARQTLAQAPGLDKNTHNTFHHSDDKIRPAPFQTGKIRLLMEGYLKTILQRCFVMILFGVISMYEIYGLLRLIMFNWFEQNVISKEY